MADFSIYSDFSELPENQDAIVAAIGNFDGCHRGHQRVLASATSLARATGRKSLMMTFEPHPRDLFAPEPFLFRLTNGSQKARFAKAFGLDGILLAPFDKKLAAVPAEEFVDNIIVGQVNAGAVVVGADFHFGKARLGTPEFLADAGTRKGFEVHILNLLQDEGVQISSTRIRDALSIGAVDVANHLLGYHWIVEGTVILGDQRGRELGYPTANFDLQPNSNLKQGVYAVRARIDGEVFDAVASYGKPMFNNTQPPFEVHIFDFDRDIYGHTIEVALESFIRGQIKFDGLEALITQMDADSIEAKKRLAVAKPLSELDAQIGLISRG